MSNSILKLQNGSDIRGTALDSVPGEKINLTPRIASQIGASFGRWLAKKSGKNINDLKICIGRDPRISGKILSEALILGIKSCNIEAFDAGLASTPAMFMSCVDERFNFDGAVMVTASHLPSNRNGFKFFTPFGGLDSNDIKDILVDVKEKSTIPDKKQNYEHVPLMKAYSSHLRDIILEGINEYGLKDLSGMKIVVDAGNGSGGFFANDVLLPLGADISGSQFLEPDGEFPNHVPNPEDTIAMKSISDAVKMVNADLGIIFDTDVDRSAAVGKFGKPIQRNEIIALASAIGSVKHPGGTVVTDSITSNELTDYLENSLGLKHLRYKRGYKNVINKAKELHKEDAFLAIETSGHAAYSDNHYLDDGAYLACLIIIEAARLKIEGKDILSLISDMKSPAESKEFRFKIFEDLISKDSLAASSNVTEFSDYADIVIDNMRKWATETDGLSVVTPNYEGVRVNYNILNKDSGIKSKGWFLLRKSLHDPVMPLNIESDTDGGISEVLSMIKLFLSQYKALKI